MSAAKDRGGFNFSAAMKAKGGNWTFEELNKFLADPRGYIPGTAMTFAGIKSDQQRADVIDYLHTLSDNPLPLPKAGGKCAGSRARRAGGAKPAEAPKPAPSRPRRPSLRLRRRSDRGSRFEQTRPGASPAVLLWRPVAAFGHGNLTVIEGDLPASAGGGPKNRHNRRQWRGTAPPQAPEHVP